MSTLLKICNGIQPLKNILKPELNAAVTTVRFRRQNYPRLKFPFWYLKQQKVLHNEHITKQNKEFIKEVIDTKYINSSLGTVGSTHVSPLKEQPIEPRIAEWDASHRRTGVIARKLGVYPLYMKNGQKILTTLLQVVDNHVISYTPPEEHNSRAQKAVIIKRKLGCLLVGAESTDPQTFTKEYCGLFNKSGVMPKKKLARFFVTPEGALQPGTPLYATHFKAGDVVDCRAKTIDRGFQGVMRRWGFKGMPATHGVTKTHRRPGNIGSGRDRGVMPGTKLPGHMGNKHRILRGLRILRINTKYQVLWVVGHNIPGPTNCFVQIYDSLFNRRIREDREPQLIPPYFPTYFPKEGEELPEEMFVDDVHMYSDPTIFYEEETK